MSVGMLFLKSSLSHLGAASVKLFITARDGEGLTSDRPAVVTINVLQSAQAPAMFQRSRYTFTVPEDAPVGTSVGTVEAINPTGQCCKNFLKRFLKKITNITHIFEDHEKEFYDWGSCYVTR